MSSELRDAQFNSIQYLIIKSRQRRYILCRHTNKCLMCLFVFFIKKINTPVSFKRFYCSDCHNTLSTRTSIHVHVLRHSQTAWQTRTLFSTMYLFIGKPFSQWQHSFQKKAVLLLATRLALVSHCCIKWGFSSSAIEFKSQPLKTLAANHLPVNPSSTALVSR